MDDARRRPGHQRWAARTRALAARDGDQGARFLWAELRGDGSLVIAGQDLSAGGTTAEPRRSTSPATATDHEYATAIAPADIPQALEHLGLAADGDPLDELASLPEDELFTVTGRLRRSGLATSTVDRSG